MSSLQGKVAIVTGSSSGIGQSIAVRLAADGAKIVINYSGHPEGAEETLKQVEQAGSKGVIAHADLSKVAEAHSLVERAWQEFGSAEILINNAGAENKTEFAETTEEDFDHIIGVNLKGAFFATQKFVQRLSGEKKPGRIVNISSVHEDMAFPGFATYCASKGGLRMLMRNLAVELGPFGITINNIAPGSIATPINKSLLEDKPKLHALLQQIPLGRLGTPEDVAGLVAFLVSDEAAYITGATYYIDGGLSRNYHEQ